MGGSHHDLDLISTNSKMTPTTTRLARLRTLVAKTNASGPGLTNANKRQMNTILLLVNYDTLGTNNKRLYNRALNATIGNVEIKGVSMKKAGRILNKMEGPY
jgi:hypothetical protein